MLTDCCWANTSLYMACLRCCSVSSQLFQKLALVWTSASFSSGYCCLCTQTHSRYGKLRRASAPESSQPVAHHTRHVILQGVGTDLLQQLEGHRHAGSGLVEHHLPEECDTDDDREEKAKLLGGVWKNIQGKNMIFVFYQKLLVGLWSQVKVWVPNTWSGR